MGSAKPRPTVLIVEDEPLVLEITSEEFVDAGYEVISVADGLRAMEHLAGEERIDLLFTDIRVEGELDGWSIAEAARDLRPTLPVIYATGFTAQDIRMVKGGVFFKKPYRPSAIIAAAAGMVTVPDRPL